MMIDVRNVRGALLGCMGTIVALASTAAAADQPPTMQESPAPSAGGATTVPPPAQQREFSELIEIVVTASKREQVLSDVPMSITTLTGDQLLSKGVTDVEDLVKVTPGLSYAESGNGVPVYSLRGVGFFDTSLGARPTVSVYADEVPLPFSIMAAGATLDLARVEVLKGPQGTLFGQNATGGALNYIAARPTDELAGAASVSYDRFDAVDATGYLSGPLTSTLGARFSARVQEGGDWQRSYTRDDSLGAKRFNQGRLLLDWQPADRLAIKLGINGFTDESDTQAGQLVDRIYSVPAVAGQIPAIVNYPVAPGDQRASDWDAGLALRRDNDFYQVSLRGDYDLTDRLTLTSLTAYSEMNIEQLMDQDGSDQHASLTNITGTLSSRSQELRLSGLIGPAQIVIGGNYSRDESDEDDGFTFPYTTSGISGHTDAIRLVGTQDFDTQAVFANVDVDLGAQFIAHAGVRYTETTDEFFSCGHAASDFSAVGYTATVNFLRSTRGLPPVTLQNGDCVTLDENFESVGLKGELSENNVSWRAGLDWKPALDTLIYANVSRGYKAGSAPTLPAISADQLTPVTQESVLAYEIGIKTPIVPRKLDVSAALFYYDYTDKQVLGRRPTFLGPLAALTNVPESSIKGAEFQINAFPVRGLTLSLGGTYLDSEVTADFINTTILGRQANFKDNAFPYTPEYQLVGDAEYQWSLTSDLAAIVGTNFNYRSETNAGFGDDPRLDIDAYTVIDARIGIRAGDRRWEATLFGRNLTDEYYWTNVARLSDVIRRYAGQPRTYGIQLSARF